MILDLSTIFSGAVAADGSISGQSVVTTAISTNIMDLRGIPSSVDQDDGIMGKPLFLIFQTMQGFNNLTQFTANLEVDDASNFQTSTVLASRTFALSDVSGANTTFWRLPMPMGINRRYMGVRYSVSGTSPTTGSVLAYMSTARQRNIIYPGNFLVR